MQKLFEAQTANDVTQDNAIVIDTNGKRDVHAFGTFDGATLSVYLSLNGTSNGKLLPDLTFTDDGFVTLDLKAGTTVWAHLTGVGTTSVNLFIGNK